MPQLELTELELKALWLVLDKHVDDWSDTETRVAAYSLFDVVYRAYRGMPPKAA